MPTWITTRGYKIVCSDEKSMKHIAAEYFPQVPLNAWRKEKPHDGHDDGRVYHYPADF